jgi:hypothetical protein
MGVAEIDRLAGLRTVGGDGAAISAVDGVGVAGLASERAAVFGGAGGRGRRAVGSRLIFGVRASVAGLGCAVTPLLSAGALSVLLLGVVELPSKCDSDGRVVRKLRLGRVFAFIDFLEPGWRSCRMRRWLMSESSTVRSTVTELL